MFSARDKVGNRGTEVDSGAVILIDTDGPAVMQMLVSPVSPIKTDQVNPTTVTVDFSLNEAPKFGTVPQFSYRLSGAGRTVQPITDLVQTSELSWRTSFVLPTDAGLTDPENLSLVFTSVDDLDNAGNRILVDNRFQVYQGELHSKRQYHSGFGLPPEDYCPLRPRLRGH